MHPNQLLAQALQTIAPVLAQIQDEADMVRMLDDLLTPQEITEVAERIKMVQALKAGKTQRAVAEELGVSVTTVNRASRMLKYGTGAFGEFV